MNDEEIVGYLIRRELEDGTDEFWHPDDAWVSDPNEAKLYEDDAEANETASTLRASGVTDIFVEDVIEDDGEDDLDDDEENE